MNNNTWKLGIDTGGTFTDCIAVDPSGNSKRIKVLSSSALRGKVVQQVDPHRLRVSTSWNLIRNILTGYTFTLLGAETFASKIRDFDPVTKIVCLSESIKGHETENCEFEVTAGEEAPTLAARVATETPLMEALPAMEMRLGSTKGTNALLERKGARVCFIVTQGLKDLIEIGTQQRPDIFALHVTKPHPIYASVLEIEERVAADGTIVTTLSDKEIERLLIRLESDKPDSIAVALLNSYANSTHEKQLQKVLMETGFSAVSLSSDMANELKILSRAHTTVVNAYLKPIIQNYLSSVKAKFSKGKLRVMTSYGGLIDSEQFMPKDSLLSGPAGGVVGAASIAKRLGEEKVITFDMGGTSTDVSRIAGHFDYSFESEIDGIPVFIPSISIETVAAGGGSVCDFDGFKFTVGPESAGARPGPACYGAGGPLTITDVNYLLGRLDQDNFGIPINKNAALTALRRIRERLPQQEPVEKILTGFLRIANEKMAGAIRKISLSKGYDTKDFTLLAFGGAGGQNACALADELAMKKIIVPFDAGLLSAYGMSMAEIERFSQKQLLTPLTEINPQLGPIFKDLEEEAVRQLNSEGFSRDDCYTKLKQVFMRFAGQESSLEIIVDSPQDLEDLFRKKYEKMYGHWLENGVIEVESVKVVVAGRSPVPFEPEERGKKYEPVPGKKIRSFVKNEWQEIAAFQWEKLATGAEINGPALLLSQTSTLFIEQDWAAEIRAGKDALLTRVKANGDSSELATNEFAELELFTNRFRSVASEMGAILQRSSFSVNVKERLDFSCALLDPEGYLVANAPHIPVHLGSLGICVRSVIAEFTLAPGDVIITNHPAFGGSHLPDVTLISGVFDEQNTLLGYVANRAHHAELGGKTPGSMPPDAKNLEEEGVVISPTYLIKEGKAQWDAIRERFAGSKFPSRSVEENIADLNGALASIRAGIQALRQLNDQFGTRRVKAFMGKLQDYASACLASAFENMEDSHWEAKEYMDDGHCISVHIKKDKQKIVIDFSGTSATHPGNLNATLAVVNSAVIYVLRLLIQESIPLNEGILKNIHLAVPPKTFLNPDFDRDPSKCPAVVGGNTEVSQRLVDTLIKALKLSACSQGTMNNLIFGNEKFGFYETICGGTGAGNGFDGADAVHHHMTNTKITDPEVMEKRYPVRLERMEVRKNSGGKGKWKGGNGIIREIKFLEGVNVSVLTQHREMAPYGMEGGEEGKVGRQWIVTRNGQEIPLKAVDGASMKAGDRIIIETPGGGGWGRA